MYKKCHKRLEALRLLEKLESQMPACGEEASEDVLGAETAAEVVSRLGILSLLCLRPLQPLLLLLLLRQVLLLPLAGGQPLPPHRSPVLKADILQPSQDVKGSLSSDIVQKKYEVWSRDLTSSPWSLLSASMRASTENLSWSSVWIKPIRWVRISNRVSTTCESH